MRHFVPPLVLIVLSGCGVFGEDQPRTPPPDTSSRMLSLAAVCKGTGASNAPDYAHDDDHRAVVVEGKGESMNVGTGRLPENWTAEFPYENLDEVDMVVCGERIAAKAVRLCDDSGGQKDAIKWHTATYSFTARSARTGKPLGKPKTIKATNTACPTNVSVGKDYIPLDQFAVISKSDLKDFAEPYLED